MTVSYGQHAYLLCNGVVDSPSGKCRAFFLPVNCSDPVARGDILVHQLDARQQAEAAGWKAFPFEGPHYCPACKDSRPL